MKPSTNSMALRTACGESPEKTFTLQEVPRTTTLTVPRQGSRRGLVRNRLMNLTDYRALTILLTILYLNGSFGKNIASNKGFTPCLELTCHRA